MEREFTAANAAYQNIVDSVRRRENFWADYNGGGWRGHTGLAHSRYPNLAAECDARRWEISTVVQAANVTRDVMAGVMEDGDKLMLHEMSSIAQRIESNLDYLYSPVLSLVNPNTRKGRIRMLRLESALSKMREYRLSGGQPECDAIDVLAAMKQGHSVTYAAWAWAVRMMEWNIYEHQMGCLREQSVRKSRIVLQHNNSERGKEVNT